ncbi:hypothetical protein EJ08DRAFT_164487 [Tothia fuscella]|uniref:Uncharacterized protein n=1 Tax=Tothia fuscella TaxID=1048955 RepID=A0A9P4TZV7_9PEZI|nr:hypothetical protein EJ08DRAFT_164487 [Tothia fuscella]
MAPVITGLFLAFLALHTSVAVPQRNERRDGHEGNSASAVLLPRMEYVMDGHAAVPVPYDLPEVDESDSDDNFYVYPGGGEADHDCRADEEIGYEENGYAKRSLLHHLLERAKKDFSIRDLISTITGKKYGPSFNADPKQRALWAEKNQEGKWKLGKRNVFKKSTPKLKPDSTWERDHVLEIQRFEHLWKGDQPKDAGFLAGSWQRMKEATNKNTDPNSSPEKKLWGSTIHHTPNLIKIEKKANKLKGVIVCQSNKASAGPKLAKSWSRSQLWFVIVYIHATIAADIRSPFTKMWQKIWPLTRPKSLAMKK